MPSALHKRRWTNERQTGIQLTSEQPEAETAAARAKTEPERTRQKMRISITRDHRGRFWTVAEIGKKRLISKAQATTRSEVLGLVNQGLDLMPLLNQRPPRRWWNPLTWF